jgi:HK97 family phage prohead protease
MARPVQTKDFRLEIKAVGEDGTFEGYLSVYDVVDLGNDLVEKGAFTKTIQEQKGLVPMLWAHDQKQPLGVLHLEDDDTGLKVNGEFFLEESEKAREIHAMSKKFHEKGRPMGLSIGYEAIKKEVKAGIRRLKELKLHEGSPTLFPMLPVAQITAIKTQSDGSKSDFATEFERIQLSAMRVMMCEALYSSLDSILWDWSGDMDAAAKVQASDESIMQFHAGYTEFLPKLLEMWGEKKQSESEQKAGRRLSASSRAQVEEAITKLQALLQDDSATSDEEAGKSSAPEPPPAQADSDKPKINLHLIADSFKFQSIGDIK